MPSHEEEADSSGAGKWFLKKLVASPATWFGTVVGVAGGLTIADVSGPWAAGFTGTFLGIGAALIAWLAATGIRASHARARAEAEQAELTASRSKENLVVDHLRQAGQEDDATLLEKMFADRDAIERYCAERGDDDPEAAHTMALVAATISASCLRSEELQDLVRRSADALLDAPEDVDEQIATLRSDLTRAYQAVADTRSRLRRGERLPEVDFLANPKVETGRDLPALAGRLEEETELARRVEKRLDTDYRPEDYSEPIEFITDNPTGSEREST